MLDWFAGLVGSISTIMYSYVLIIMLLGVGLYFTFRTKFIQVRMLGESIRVITEKKKDDNAVSSFQALMVSPTPSPSAVTVLYSGCGSSLW